MKKILKSLMVGLLAASTFLANAQNTPPKSTDIVSGPASKVTGKMDAAFNSRATDADGKPVSGVPDVYTFTNLSVVNTLVFNGTIKSLPTMLSSVIGRETQAGSIEYKMDLGIRNPANPDQQRTIGKLIGTVPLDKSGTYRFDSGNMRIAVDAGGAGSEFQSAFRGIAIGKAPSDSSVLSRAKKQTQTVTKMVQGKPKSIKVDDYDKLTFQGLVMASGPVRSYPETTVNGDMLFDYARSAWYFNGVTMTYVVEGKTYTDKLSGNVKWVEPTNRKSTGEGEYQLDLRVNEPEVKGNTEAAVFAAADDEAAFFATDTSIPSLSGSITYKDSFRGDTVVSSSTVWDLGGNQLSKVQIVNLTKLLAFVAVKPVNDE